MNLSKYIEHVEKSINTLLNRFANQPYYFYTESDIHCYLYYLLYKGSILKRGFRTADGMRTILLHKEYPTRGKYRIEKDLLTTEKGRRKGRFDLCIWDPGNVEKGGLGDQKTMIAIELALNEIDAGLKHLRNDILKLSDQRNGVQQGYILHLVRDYPKPIPERQIQEVRELCQKYDKIKTFYVEVRTKPKYIRKEVFYSKRVS